MKRALIVIPLCLLLLGVERAAHLAGNGGVWHRLMRAAAADRLASSTTTEGSVIYNTDSDRAELIGASSWGQLASGQPTDDRVLVGDGTQYLNAQLTDGPLRYNTASNSFDVVAINAAWNASCPAGDTCESAAGGFLGVYTPSHGVTPNEIACNAVTAGTGLGSADIIIYDNTSASIFCTATFGCEDIDRVGLSQFCTGAGNMTPDDLYLVYADYSACTTPPDTVVCNVTLEP